MFLPRLLALLMFKSRLVLGAFDVDCGPYSTSSLMFWTTPLRYLVSEFLHRSCRSSSDEDVVVDVTKPDIALWTRYANLSVETNTTTIYVAGYAFGVPPCSTHALGRWQLLRALLNMTGGNLSLTDGALMPIDYLSYSVIGAQPLLGTGNYKVAIDASTNRYGHFAAFVNLPIPHFTHPISTFPESNVNVSLLGCRGQLTTSAGHAQVLHIPRRGLTIVSDLDDILRVAEIWNFKQALLSTFVRPFEPWLNMCDLLTAWMMGVPSVHFHYTTDAPEFTHQFYTDGIERLCPQGTYDFRPMLFDTVSTTLNPRYYSNKRLIETFPERKFVLIGDTATGSTLSSYVKLANEFPAQVQCIIIRDVSAIEPSNWIVPELQGLRRLSGKFIIFKTPRDLTNTLSLMQMLADDRPENSGQIGCGGYDIDTQTRGYGIFASWRLTLWNGLCMYYQCFILLWHRPHMACPLDRREKVKYYHAGYEPEHDDKEIINNVRMLPQTQSSSRRLI